MKILIPKYCLDYDLNDRQKIFMAYLLLLEKNLGPSGHEYWFNIHSSDIKRILDNYHWVKQKPNMYALEELINVVTYDQYNNYVQFNPNKKIVGCKGRSANMLIESFTTISDPDSILLYSYILGRCTDSNIISNNTNIIYHDETSRGTENHIWKQIVTANV